MATPAQRWARERNWNKAMLVSSFHNIRNLTRKSSTLEEEHELVNEALSFLYPLLEKWDEHSTRSKNKYLRKEE